MASPIGLKFLNDIEKGSVYQVQMSLKRGYADPNKNYLNVFPLNLAIEQGDVDIAAVLLMAGADPLIKSNPKNTIKITCAAELADSMAKDPKEKFRVEAAIIAELINDPQKLKERYADAMEKVKREHAKEEKMLVRIMGAGVMVAGVVFWHYYVSPLR